MRKKGDMDDTNSTAYFGENMKKTLLPVFYVLHLVCVLYAASPCETMIQQTYPEAVEIQTAGSYKEYTVFIVVYEADWWERLIIYNAKTNKITECTELDEASIHSARIITTCSSPFIEAVGITHMGNGSIHLLDFDGNEFFSYVFVDYHYENTSFYAVNNLDIFKHYKPNAAESYSRIIEGGTLQSDYSLFDQGLIRIFGTISYRAVNEQTDTEKTIDSVEIERLFKRNTEQYGPAQYSGAKKLHGGNNTTYKLIKKTGKLDGIFGYAF